MAEIGVRSGKIKPGVYRCGPLVIARARTGWWWVYADYGSDREQLAHPLPFKAQGDACTWARSQPQT